MISFIIIVMSLIDTLIIKINHEFRITRFIIILDLLKFILQKVFSNIFPFLNFHRFFNSNRFLTSLVNLLNFNFNLIKFFFINIFINHSKFSIIKQFLFLFILFVGPRPFYQFLFILFLFFQRT